MTSEKEFIVKAIRHSLEFPVPREAFELLEVQSYAPMKWRTTDVVSNDMGDLKEFTLKLNDYMSEKSLEPPKGYLIQKLVVN